MEKKKKTQNKSGENTQAWTLLRTSKQEINVAWTRVVGCRNKCTSR